MATPTTIKTEGGFPYPIYNPRARPEFRRPFSDGSMAIHTSDLQLAASLPTPSSFMNSFPYDQHQSFFQPYDYNMDLMPTIPMNAPLSVPVHATEAAGMSIDDRSRSLSRGSIGKAKTARSRSGRKGSMTDVKPVIARVRTASSRAMSYSHPDGRIGLGLDTHLEHQRTNSVSPPDYAYGLAGMPAPPSWNGSGSLQSMQSFGTTIDEAVLDSPISPSAHLPPLPPDASEESRKQRRRECHNLVEKRRREHINTKIDELAGLLPAQYQQADEIAMEQDDEEEEAESPKTKKKNRRNSVAKQKELGTCKGRILTHSVQYIHDLRQVNNMQATRIQQLEALLAGGETFVAPPSIIQQANNSFYEAAGLEPLRPSPEPESFGQGWNTFNPVFEESPDSFDTSSGSASMMAEPSSQNLPQAHAHSRKDSQVGLRMGMSGMELDAVFAGGRRDDDMPIRW